MMKVLGLLVLFCATAFGSWPLDSVFARADSCIQITWTPTNANTDLTWYGDNGARCTGTDAKYKNCDFIAGTTYKGIAYSYGGEDTPLQFRQRVLLGLAVGSHLCHYQTFGDPTPAVTGTDCTGFLCYVWNAPRVSTGVLVQTYPHVTLAELKPGDALVKSGSHAVLVAETINLKKAVIMESTSAVNSCRERVVDLTGTDWAAYTPIRNPSLEMTPILPSQSIRNPFVRVENNRVIFEKCAEQVEITVYSAKGTILFHVNRPAGTGIVNLPMFTPGVYLVTIKSGQNEVTQSIVAR